MCLAFSLYFLSLLFFSLELCLRCSVLDIFFVALGVRVGEIAQHISLLDRFYLL